ncbi:hypothetical protein OIU84_005894 [Salix udensis]|uniref:Uncharacterized protein n=1 Tax=Salix udensis TaxID=889485 RepID=A0AAD6JZ30_9ROSI|nr:hypothetical protein OIU84_005894 [Salix udensis]
MDNRIVIANFGAISLLVNLLRSTDILSWVLQEGRKMQPLLSCSFARIVAGFATWYYKKVLSHH